MEINDDVEETNNNFVNHKLIGKCAVENLRKM